MRARARKRFKSTTMSDHDQPAHVNMVSSSMTVNNANGIAALVIFAAISLNGQAVLAQLATAPADSTKSTPTSPASNAPDSTRAKYVLPLVEVKGSFEGSLTPRSAASQGFVTPEQLARRPLRRVGDALETIPGMLISQHSGEGKANQYYLRGFNLDHGTDFATAIAGVPVNMPTHAHGQGYTDLTFVIPELVSGVQYRKGPYSAENGDFSSAGSASILYRNTLAVPIVSITPGELGYRRAFAAASRSMNFGSVLGALEFIRNDGPWDRPDDFRKVNGVVRYSLGGSRRGLSVTAMGYDGRWNATDQVPERALASGRISRFGEIDSTDGGNTSRYSLSAELQHLTPYSITKASAYLIRYRLELFSNFTYFLDDTVRGDQFEQADRRVVTGFRILHRVGDQDYGLTIGAQARNDNIERVGLYHTEARRILGVTREDHVVESSISPFLENDVRWSPWLRTILGVRADLYRFSVASSYAPFSGRSTDAMFSPKASVVLGPWGGLELYLNGGYGFHSEDARGASISGSASSLLQGQPLATEHFPLPQDSTYQGGGPTVEPIPLLARTKGAEVGARFTGGSSWSAGASLWGLDIASEAVFVGDAGTTAPNRPSRRTGIELSTEVRPMAGLRLDSDLAYSRARFRDPYVEDRIPGAVEGVVSAGIEYEHLRSGASAALRVRFFGPRPLIEDNSVRSKASTILNGQLGYGAHRSLGVALQVFNVLDQKSSDIDYFYTSRLPGEPAWGVDDVHTHPQEPRSFRLVISAGMHG